MDSRNEIFEVHGFHFFHVVHFVGSDGAEGEAVNSDPVGREEDVVDHRRAGQDRPAAQGPGVGRVGRVDEDHLAQR